MKSALVKSALAKVAFLLLVFGVADVALGEMVTINSARDNTLYEDPTGALSNGAGQYFFAGDVLTGEARRGLLFFDVDSMVPAGATITNVTLTLHMSRTITAASDISLHSATTAWGEGASDAGGQEGGGTLAAPGDATWLHSSFPGDFWTTAGGDFDAAATATTSVDQVGFYDWNSAAMTGVVQNWLDNPSGNLGWVVMGLEGTGASAKRFDTRENPDAAFRPMLAIEYTAVPEPGSCLLFSLAAIGLGVTRRRRG